ncbi:MAG: phosphoribosylglycinamide formyltransferase [Planctomycetes bacterium]|nr:phosphoribosylglycinamide formyltransferase [Planctomycetota bacterium]
MSGKARLAVLLSGSGTTLQNILDRIGNGTLPAEVAVVVSSRKDAYGLIRAEKAGAPAHVVSSREYADWDDHSRAVTEVLDRYGPDLVVMAGYMCLYRFPARYEHRIMNIHPALIPAFCGKGLYGHLAHKAVIDYGVRVTGCTVHFVDNEYDHGPIILQRTVAVRAGDTADTLAERVQAEERIAYPEAIRLFAEDRLIVEGGTCKVLPGDWTPTSACGLE